MGPRETRIVFAVLTAAAAVWAFVQGGIEEVLILAFFTVAWGLREVGFWRGEGYSGTFMRYFFGDEETSKGSKKNTDGGQRGGIRRFRRRH